MTTTTTRVGPVQRRWRARLALVSVAAMVGSVLVVGSAVPVGAVAPDWEQLGLDIDGEAGLDWSGVSVAMSGDGETVIIGARHNAGGGPVVNLAGHARVFDWSGSAWVQRGLDIDGEATGDFSGTSVAMSGDGDTVIIGAPGNGGSFVGHARVFDWSGSAWVQRGIDIDGEAALDQSGWSVAMSGDGDTVIIGAPDNAGGGSNAGHARVFDWSGSAWVQRGIDIDGEAAGDGSGLSVAMSGGGDTVIIGAPGNGGGGSFVGHARVFDWSGSAWVQRGLDIDGEAAGDGSGSSVAMSGGGDTVIIGATGNGGGGSGAGHARVFDWSGSAWVQRGIDIDGEAAGDLSGGSVAMSGDGDTVIIGATGNGGGGSGAGHARVFDWSGSAWVQRGIDIDGEAASDNSGGSVAMSGDGDTVIIGAPLNDGGGSDAGHARVYVSPPVVPVVVPGVVSVVEGDTGTVIANVPVSLSEPSAEVVTVDWETVDWTAVAPDDYVAASGTVTFFAGETKKTVPITINGDELIEPDEGVALVFTNPTNAVVGGFMGLGAAVIVNDDKVPFDDFAEAGVLSGASGSVSASTVGATEEVGEPASDCAVPVAPVNSVWFSWTAPADGPVIFDTLGSGYDTYLHAYSGMNLATLVEVDCNDDILTGGSVQSAVVIEATAGATYHVQVDGYQGNVGDFVLSWGPMPVATPGGVIVNPEGDSGTSLWNLPISLDVAANVPITIDWATGDIVANPDVAHPVEDFVFSSGTVTFLPGETTQNAVLEIVGDTVNEPSVMPFGADWGLVGFFNPTYAAFPPGLLGGIGLFLIANDDAP